MCILSQEECKGIALRGLVKLREICKEYGLKYYLGYGTLLGSVRHSGFIPWDDDIDVLMPRMDYEKLISVTDKIENNDWRLLSYKTEKKYLRTWAKFVNKKTIILPKRFNNGFTYGISIDIFPLDYIGADNEEDAKKIVRKAKYDFDSAMKILRPIGVVKKGPVNFIKRIIKKEYYLLYGRRKIDFVSEARKLEECGSTQQTDYLANLTIGCIIYLANMIIGREEKTALFENEFFSVPYDSHEVLKKCYGDYMILPPIKERVPIHHGKIYKFKKD